VECEQNILGLCIVVSTATVYWPVSVHVVVVVVVVVVVERTD